jgi:hypothetical protein
MNKLTEIKEALKAATPGPWKWEGKYPDVLRGVDNQHIMDFGDNKPYYPVEGKEPAWDDYNLIGNAPEYITYLISLLEEKNKEIQEKDKALAFYSDNDNWELPYFGAGHSFVTTDRGKLARKALNTSSNNEGETQP